MTAWNLPDGCTDADIDRAFGDEGRHGVYTVTIVRTIEMVVEVEASSDADAEQAAKIVANHEPLARWSVTDEDVSIEEPSEEDPDDARDARIDWEMDKER